jgi:hypothetical protein
MWNITFPNLSISTFFLVICIATLAIFLSIIFLCAVSDTRTVLALVFGGTSLSSFLIFAVLKIVEVS